MKKTLYIIVALAGCFQACDKNETIPDRFTPTVTSNANVKFLNLSPDAPVYNLFVNGSKVTAATPSSTDVEQGLVFGSLFPNTIAYASVPSGSVKIEGKVTDSSTVRPGEILFTANNTIAPGKFYTFVVTDSLSKLTTVLVEDDPSIPDTSKAYFRIGNFVSNTPAVKVEMISNLASYSFSKVFSNLAFKQVTPFEPIDIVSGVTYKVYLKNAVTDAKLDSISAFSPVKTKKYTFYTRGVFGQTGTSSRRPLILQYTVF